MTFDPTPVTDWLLFFIAICTVIGLFARWITKGAKRREEHANEQRAEMVQLIKDVTYQIRTDANGGQSLNDLTQTVKAVDGKVDGLVNDIALLKSAVVTLENEKEGIE